MLDCCPRHLQQQGQLDLIGWLYRAVTGARPTFACCFMSAFRRLVANVGYSLRERSQ